MIQSDFVYSCVRPLWGNEIGQPSVWESWRKKHSRQGKCINSRSQSRKKFGVFKKQKGASVPGAGDAEEGGGGGDLGEEMRCQLV